MITHHWHIHLGFDFGEPYALLVNAMITRSDKTSKLIYQLWTNEATCFANLTKKEPPFVRKWRCTDDCFADSTKEAPNDTED